MGALSSITERYLRLRHFQVWFLALKFAIMAVGFLVISAAFIATFTTLLLFGRLLLAGGVVPIANVSLAHLWGGFSELWTGTASGPLS
jgi:uncharacterized membrane protein HdeD (DUF308 family)